MKYKLRSSSKNATESKSKYHSYSRSSSTGNNSGPAEKMPKVEYNQRGRSPGIGPHLRRKPNLPSLISIETQTDDYSKGNYDLEKVVETDKSTLPCEKMCELCGGRSKKRRFSKIEDDKISKPNDKKREKRLSDSEKSNSEELWLTEEKKETIVSNVGNTTITTTSSINKPTLGSLPLEIILHVMQYLDAKSILCIYRLSKWYFNVLYGSNAFWKMICVKEELANYSCISEDASSLDNTKAQPTNLDILSSCTKISEQKELEDLDDGAVIVPPFERNRVDSSESEAESDSTARGMSGSSLTSYPTSRTSKRRKISSNCKKKAAKEIKPAGLSKKGFSDRPMHGSLDIDDSLEGRVSWHKVYLRGLQMRRNIVHANFEAWRIYANSNVPVSKITPDLDFNTDVKQRMMNYPKLSVNDDLKIDWDDHHLVVFHFFRGDGESCTIRVWDISSEPKFLFAVEKGIECITDKVFVVNGHVVIVPSWPIASDAIVMTLAIDESVIMDDGTITEGGQMPEIGKFRFCSDEAMTTIDENWEHTQLRVVRDMAMVVIRSPNWQCLVVKLPSCELKHSLQFESIPRDFDCQQIRSYKTTAMILFNHKLEESSNQLVTIDVGSSESSSSPNEYSSTTLRSIYACNDTVDVALFTDPEEIYLMKRNGDVVIFDPNSNTETIKIPNPSAEGRASPQSEYQLFVNRKEQICVMQSAAEVPHGRNIKVYSYNQELQYTINLDIARYGMSRDESICIYTNGAFLAAADSKKFAIFNVKTGKYLGEIRIPAHLERSKGKEEKYCMFEQTGLSLFIFDEDKLITVHDYERSFPAVLDIYKFW